MVVIAERHAPLTLSRMARIGLGMALAAASGALMVLAFPPYNQWYLIWLALVPMLLAQYRVMPARFSSLASAAALGGWAWGFFGPIFAGTGSFMEWLPGAVFLISFVTDRGLRAFHERTGYRWFVLSGAVSWVGFEMLRLFLPIAASWGFLAHTQYAQVWLIQPVRTFGVLGLSFLIVLVNYALAQALLAACDRRWRLDPAAPTPAPALSQRWLAAAALLLAGWVGYSLLALQQPLGPSVRVAAVQPAAAPVLSANRGQADLAERMLLRMREQTRAAAADGARLVVWPEAAMLFDPQVNDRLALARLARETQAHLAVGYLVPLDARVFRNEATVIDPQGRFLGVFGKDHPVVFGGETSPTRGSYPVYDTAIGRLGTIICYDLDFTDTARKLARQGAQLIAVPSQDWPAIANVHYTHLVFRAVENGVAMIKADGSYDSAIIDPRGRIVRLAVSPAGQEATLVADVPLGAGTTLATRLGDWVGWLALAGTLGFMLLPALLRRRP